MTRTRRTGNPLGAAIVGLVIAAMGLYLVVQGDTETARFYGGALIVLGVLGAVVNLLIRRRYQREGR